MKISKILVSLLTGTIILTSLSACSFNFSTNAPANETQISHIAFEQKAYSQDDVVQYIMDAMTKNETSCKIFVEKEELIDVNAWLYSINGIEHIQCEYRRVKNGFNMIVSFECWDNYAIMNAYRTGDTSTLNDRQKKLLDQYLSILNEVTSPNNTAIENELAIHDYLVSNIDYIDTGNSIFNAYDALINGKAVCSGYTECFKTFMDMLGIENATISGTAGNQQHIWNVVKLDGEWYHVDVTWDDPVGSTSNHIDHSYFNITDADMAIDHDWNVADYAQYIAGGKKYSYISYRQIPSANSQWELNRLIAGAVHNRSDYIEFTTNLKLHDDDPDKSLKQAIANAGIQLSYSYKSSRHKDYILYMVSFTY